MDLDIPTLIRKSSHYNDPGKEGDEARQLINYFYSDPNSYIYASQILESAEAPLVLKIGVIGSLSELIKKRWGTISDQERENIRSYLLNLVFSLASNQSNDQNILNKADLTLVDLLIQEMPERFSTFFTDLINSAGTSEFFCYNNIQIIKYFCEQVLDNNGELLTYKQTVKLTSCIQNDAEAIYNFLENVLTSTTNSSLINIGLSTLKFFIRWINPKKIISTKVFEALCKTFLPQPDYVVEILDLFYEIFGNPDLPKDFANITAPIFKMMVSSVNTFITSQQDFDYNNPKFSHFFRILPMTLTIFLDKFGIFVEIPENIESIQAALNWLLSLTRVEDLDVLNTCCNFWLLISRRCHRERNSQQASALTTIYAPILPLVRRCLIEKMQRPDDIIIDQDESGNVVRETRRNTQTLMIYSIMKECLVYLTVIDPDDTIAAIQNMIDYIIHNWQPEIYDRICWSVGAITRTLDFEKEKTFITRLLQVQLDMSRSTNNPNERAIIAAGIMHVCSQYPRFLQKFPTFLRTVVLKLFDFMHQDVEGVKEMAVASFKTIADGCKRQFLNVSQDSNQPFIVEIIQQYPSIVTNLSPELTIVFFDALSIVVSSNSTDAVKIPQLELLLEPLNEQWKDCMDNFNPGDFQIAKKIAFVLSCNAVVAYNMRLCYHNQFMTIFPQMMKAYSSLSQNANQQIQVNSWGQDANKVVLQAKASIIEVIKNFVNRTSNPSASLSPIIPDLVQTIFSDYGSSDSRTRTPEVLNLLQVLFMKMQDSIANYLNSILESFYMQTVEMIMADFEQNPTFRLPFYQLLKTLVDKYLPQLLAVPDGFKIVVQTIQWGYQHPTHEVCETSLDTVDILLKSVQNTTQEMYQDFLNAFYLGFVHDMFMILTDTIHKFAFDKNVDILSKLLQINTYHLNAQAITESIIELFPNREPEVIFSFIGELITKSNNKPMFKQDIKDFLVATRQFLPMDPDLNKEETQRVENENREYLQQNVLNNEGLEMY